MIDRLAVAPLALQLLLLLGLVARVTLLVIDDRITRAPRRWLLAKLPPQGYLAYLLWCPWCVSVHASWLVIVAWVTWPGPTLVVAAGGTLAFLGGWLIEVLGLAPVPPQPPPAA